MNKWEIYEWLKSLIYDLPDYEKRIKKIVDLLEI